MPAVWSDLLNVIVGISIGVAKGWVQALAACIYRGSSSAFIWSAALRAKPSTSPILVCSSAQLGAAPLARALWRRFGRCGSISSSMHDAGRGDDRRCSLGNQDDNQRSGFMSGSIPVRDVRRLDRRRLPACPTKRRGQLNSTPNLVTALA